MIPLSHQVSFLTFVSFKILRLLLKLSVPCNSWWRWNTIPANLMGYFFIHFMLPDRIRFYKTDNFPLSHRQYQLLMHIIFLCKIPVARFRWQLQYSRLLQLVHWGKMNWKVQYLMGECDTLGKEMTQLTEDKFLSVLGLSIHKQVNLSSQVIMIQTIITSMTKQIRMKS